ncbi:unnamed protein product, partial [marine sediment metagenome]
HFQWQIDPSFGYLIEWLDTLHNSDFTDGCFALYSQFFPLNLASLDESSK